MPKINALTTPAGSGKINSAFARGGVDGLRATVSNLFAPGVRESVPKINALTTPAGSGSAGAGAVDALGACAGEDDGAAPAGDGDGAPGVDAARLVQPAAANPSVASRAARREKFTPAP
ncbi:hypothetical protein [Nigerium massiliense]|uniref:hypothetical protein n=1 Tax=Nigerium massiliense TaxID=1522317 RepID=UPI0006948807|nr:hypothetical protein [Nigerium massiliense]